VPDDISRTRGAPDANPEYATPDELMAWHLYEDPVIPEAAIEASDSGSQQQRQGPQSETFDVLRGYVWNKCGHLMKQVTSLTEQY
jgi:hypothetical protein